MTGLTWALRLIFFLFFSFSSSVITASSQRGLNTRTSFLQVSMIVTMFRHRTLLALALCSLQSVSKGSFVLYNGQELTQLAAIKGVSTSCMTAL